MSEPYEHNDDGQVIDITSGQLVPVDRHPMVVPHRAPEPVEHDDGQGDEVAVPIDPVDGAYDGPGWRAALDDRAAGRRPVVADWLKTREDFRYAAGWAARHIGHHGAYHGLRIPKYALRAAYRSPIGAAKVAGWAVRWVADAEARDLRAAAVRAEDAKIYLALSRQRNDRFKWRCIVVGLLAAAMLGGAAVDKYLAPSWAHWLTLALGVAVLGLLGSSADRPIVDRGTVVVERSPKLTASIVVTALGALGIAEISRTLARNPQGIAFPAPISRDGPGWRATIDLPHGVTATDIIEKRDKLASGLRRPLGCVWPEPVHDEHAGRLVLWVGDQDMSKAKQPAWPLLKTGRVDLFGEFPFGTDKRGRVVPLSLMFASMVIGAIPRMGKTFALRLVLLAAALDPRAELHCFDLKGTGDLGPLEPVAHRYRAGDEAEDIDYLIADMRELQAELRRRAKAIRELPRDLCPESKVTAELASRKSLGLHPIVVGIDECQRAFEHETHGRELESICTDLTKRGPALGIILLLATQRPDAKSLPTSISDNAVLRFCLKVLGQVANDQVLSTSSYKNGVRATMFSRRDLGIGYLAGEGDDPTIVRSYYIDARAAEVVVARARAAREADGRITGHAAGEKDPSSTASSILDDLAAALGDDRSAWSEVLCERLGDLRPDVYESFTPEQLAASLRPYGLSTRQLAKTIDGERINRRGITRTALQKAIAARSGDQQ